MHLNEEQVQRLLHDELSPRTKNSTREHVAVCADCRRLLSEAEREENEVYALLRALDDSTPLRVSAEAVAARARAIAPGAEVTARTREHAWLRRAAAIVLAVGIAGAAYAVPGSPVRAWVHAIVQKLAVRPTASTVKPSPGERSTGFSGIAVLPEQRLLILFKSGQGEGEVFVSLSDGREVQVRGPVGAATFTSSAEQLLIDNQDPSATFEIRIPRDAPRVEIRIGGDPVFVKEGPRITTSGSSGAAGGYLIRLTPSGS